MKMINLKPNVGLENLFFCPKCGSKNVGKFFTIPVGMKNPVSPIEEKDKCYDCKYEEPKNGFELINKIEIRNKKIETILK